MLMFRFQNHISERLSSIDYNPITKLKLIKGFEKGLK